MVYVLSIICETLSRALLKTLFEKRVLRIPKNFYIWVVFRSLGSGRSPRPLVLYQNIADIHLGILGVQLFKIIELLCLRGEYVDDD